MDIWKTFFIDHIGGFNDKTTIPDVPADVCDLACRVEMLTEEIQNLEQLIDIFSFNLQQLHKYCNMRIDDRITRNIDGEPISLIEINGLIINILSAGKSCYKYCEEVERSRFGESGMNAFREKLKDTIEGGELFYCFLHVLRDMGQHGNLIVSKKDDERLCFDLEQLLRPVQFRIPPRIKVWMEETRLHIAKELQDYPHLAVTKSLITYTHNTLLICLAFLKNNQEFFITPFRRLKETLNEHPEYLLLNDNLKDALPYKIQEGTLHVLLVQEDFEGFYCSAMNKIEHQIKKYDNGFEK